MAEQKGLKLEDFFEQSKIFKDGSVFLSEYIPDHFLYRDNELNVVGRAFAGLIKGKPGHLWLYGEPSTGKTHCIKKLTKKFNDYAEANNSKVKYIYSSAREKTLPRLYSEILLSLSPDSKRFTWNSQEAFDRILREANKYSGVNFILDELDKIKPSRGYENPINEIIGLYSRLSEQASWFNSQYMVTVITNDIKILKKKCKNDTLSSFNSKNIHFPSYNVDQLFDIFSQRAKNGFKNGAMSEGMIRRLSALIFQQSSDVRQGLRVMNEAGNIAEAKDLGKITDKILNHSFENIERYKTKEVLSKLDDSQLLLLKSITHFQMRYPKKKPTSDIIYSVYRKISKNNGMTPLKKRYVFGEVLQKLVSLGLVEKSLMSRGYKKGVLSTVQITDGEDLQELFEITETILAKRNPE